MPAYIIARVARAAMLDAVACAIAGRDERVTRELRGFALEQGSHPRASLWGTGERVSPALAALVNGAAAHALDFYDVSWAMNGHPTVPLLPAAFALAEALGRSGAELLRAYVVGFEVQGRLGQGLGKPHYERGWHATSTLGTITKPLHAGWAAHSGVLAAELAVSGFEADARALEGKGGFLRAMSVRRVVRWEGRSRPRRCLVDLRPRRGHPTRASTGRRLPVPRTTSGA